MILDLALFGAGVVLLLSGGELLVRAATAAAAALRLPTLLAGILLVGFGTSLPDLAVGVDAALVDAGDVAVGTVLGSNLCNGALVLGLAALLRPLPLARRLLRRELPLLIGVSAAVALFVADGSLARVEALLLLCALVAYIAATMRSWGEATSRAEPTRRRMPRSIAQLVASSAFGFGFLVLGAIWLVEGATLLARDLGVSEATIAISLVAVGTSLPELATTLAAIRHRASKLVMGNIIGSNLFNTMAILGLSGLASPLRTQTIQAWELAAFVAGPLAIAALARRGQLGRWAGATLLVGYAGVLVGLAYES